MSDKPTNAMSKSQEKSNSIDWNGFFANAHKHSWPIVSASVSGELFKREEKKIIEAAKRFGFESQHAVSKSVANDIQSEWNNDTLTTNTFIMWIMCASKDPICFFNRNAKSTMYENGT